jgi:hypothetical protein
MNTYLKTSLKWFAAAAIAASIGLSQGCAPNGCLLECRHLAPACALAMSEVYGVENVGIARGPSVGTNHAQCYVMDNGIKWVNHKDGSCYLGKRDNFFPEEYIGLVDYVYRWRPVIKR